MISSETENSRRQELMKHFGIGKKTLIMSGEREVLYFVTKHVQELVGEHTIWDVPVPVKLGKRKRLEWKRGDMLSLFENGYLHLEYDEYVDHEDSDERLRTILCDTEKAFGYVVRICEQRGTDGALCRRVVRGDFAYYEMNTDARTNNKMQRVLDVVRERLAWIKQGLEPNDIDRPWKTRLFF
jgi:hypothetical protein